MTEYLPSRTIVTEHGRSAMRFEPEFWDALDEICERERITLNDLVQKIEAAGYVGTRTSAVRVFVLQYFRLGASS